MRAYSITELFRLTRHELFALHAEIVAEIAALPADAPEVPVGRNNLRLIRQVLSRLRPEP